MIMKETALYLEVDEDITSAIDKLSKIDGAAVQVVVPKRSTMLQSIINLKLLKKAAADAGKELVLVTNDRVASGLAGRVGLAVAPSIGAKPVLAEPEAVKPPTNDDIIEDDEAEVPPVLPASAIAAPVAAAKRAPFFARKDVTDKPEVPEAAAVSAVAAGSGLTKGMPKVPNFKVLQKRMLWVGLAVALIVGYVVFMALFTKANVTLFAAGSKVQIDANFAVDTNGATDTAAGVLAGQAVSSAKDLSGSFAPTGQKDVGTKAHGTITFKNCEDSSNSYPLAAGNTITSQGVNFTTDAAITIPPGSFINHGTTCTSAGVTVSVTAVANGDNYNLSNATFTNSKLIGQFGISGSTSGGTSKTVTVVSQADIDKAKADLLAKDKASAEDNLKGKVPSGYRAMPDSLQATAGAAVSSPAVDQEGNSATLALPVTYTLLTVKKSDFIDYVHAQEQAQIGVKNQIYNDGIGAAQITAGDKDAKGRLTFKFATEAYGGVKLDIAGITTQLKGKRYGDAVDIATKQPGVQRAEVSISPAWATSLPKNTTKIKVTIQVADTKE